MDADAIFESLMQSPPPSMAAAVQFLAWLAARGGSVVATPTRDDDGFALSVTVRFGKGD